MVCEVLQVARLCMLIMVPVVERFGYKGVLTARRRGHLSGCNSPRHLCCHNRPCNTLHGHGEHDN